LISGHFLQKTLNWRNLMRNDTYLERRLKRIWKKYFRDVPCLNKVEIKFGRRAQKRLGSIREIFYTRDNKKFDTLILINGHFKDPSVPDFIIDATIAHELCHYAQGFASPLPQLSSFPHRGGLVEEELVNRNLGELVLSETDWLNKNWTTFLTNKKLNTPIDIAEEKYCESLQNQFILKNA
jgi:hypothetical protein